MKKIFILELNSRELVVLADLLECKINTFESDLEFLEIPYSSCRVLDYCKTIHSKLIDLL